MATIRLDIDSSIYDQDKDFQELIYALDKMPKFIIRFDQVKADKIFEHHQSIQLLINLLPQSIFKLPELMVMLFTVMKSLRNAFR